MSGFNPEFTQSRRALIDEQLALGVNQPSVMAKNLFKREPFKYHSIRTLTILIAHHLRGRDIQFTSMVAGNVSQKIRKQRKAILNTFFKQHPEMKDQSIWTMAKAILALKFPAFERCTSVTAIWYILRRYLKRKKWYKTAPAAALEPAPDKQSVTVSAIPETVATFDELVAKVSLTLPLGAHREVDKLLAVLRAPYEQLRTLKPVVQTTVIKDEKRIATLEQQITELEKELATLKAHHCPDIDAELRAKNAELIEKNTALDAENQELRGQIRNLKLRVETLSRATAPSLVARRGFAG